MTRTISNPKAHHYRFSQLRQKLQTKQGDLLAQFQQEMRQIPADDRVAATRLKLIYRQKGLNI
ncbi:MAG: hypothetical protein R3335_13195 [Anaerolineales bacterium]|nr:hypothetical protein [Anaerolineales bacterium]